MRLFSLLIVDTPIEDVFVYRTSLYCWTFDNHLRIYNIADLEGAAAEVNPGIGSLISYVLFHSQGLGASADQQQAWYHWAKSFEAYDADDSSVAINGESV